MDNLTFSGARTVSKSVLKNVAIVSMLIDHFFALLYFPYYESGLISFAGDRGIYTVGRLIGRFAFYIFAYMIADGMRHTSNKLGYIRNLFLFALISEIPFDLVHEGICFYSGYQNVYFTLALGALAIYIADYFKDKKYIASILCVIPVIAAYILKSDYSMAGVLLILLTYLFIDDYYRMIVIPPIVFILFHALQWYLKGNGFVFDPIAYLRQLMQSVNGEMLGMGSYILIYYYNGTKGKQLNKWFYYFIYPLHFMIFYFIKLFT